MNTCTEERFIRQWRDVTGSLRQLLSYGSVFLPVTSPVYSFAEIDYIASDGTEIVTGGPSGFPVETWTNKTALRIYRIITQTGDYTLKDD